MIKMFPLPISDINIQPPNEVESTGPFRQRRVYMGMPYVASVSWDLDEKEAFYLSQFFSTLSNGALPFEIELPSIEAIDVDEFYETYIAEFRTGSFRKSLSNYKKYKITATLNIEPSNNTINNSIVLLAGASNSIDELDQEEFINIFDDLVNVKFGVLS